MVGKISCLWSTFEVKERRGSHIYMPQRQLSLVYAAYLQQSLTKPTPWELLSRHMHFSFIKAGCDATRKYDHTHLYMGPVSGLPTA